MSQSDDRGFFGHPRGLSTLFFTEMWERFSYYGMRAFLMLYMVTPVAAGGLGFSDAAAGSIYGNYTGSVWGATIFGGLAADRLLGQYRSVLYGGILIAAGHVTLTFREMPFFYTGLALIVIGTGLLKANASTLVGSLYQPSDPRRDAGFSIFYMGINIGALFGPLVAGYLAERVSWHVGFGCAAVGMGLGLVQYVLGRRHLQPALDRIAQPTPAAAAAAARNEPAAPGGGLGFTAVEWKRIGAIFVLFIVATFFWGAYEQAGSTLTLFAARFTRLEILGFSFPVSWFQLVQPIFVAFIFGPLFAWMWIRLGPREPSVPAKFALALVFMSLSFLVLVPAGAMAQGEGVRVSPTWLIISYAISVLGEMCLSPVGLSAVTKLAPVRILGVMMGVWFLSNAFGNKIAGSAAGYISSMPLQNLFGVVAAILAGAALIMFVLVKPIKRLMAGQK
ncbi:MAG TPA: peptide MFS transporter [Vicinamibacterales bacterium]|jgi:POT family proton-dependent oligopeptide transporter